MKANLHAPTPGGCPSGPGRLWRANGKTSIPNAIKIGGTHWQELTRILRVSLGDRVRSSIRPIL